MIPELGSNGGGGSIQCPLINTTWDVAAVPCAHSKELVLVLFLQCLAMGLIFHASAF